MQRPNLRNNEKRWFCRLLVLLVLGLFAGSVVAEETDNKPDQAKVQQLELFSRAKGQLAKVNIEALKRTVQDLTRSFPGQYRKGQEYLERIEAYQRRLPKIHKGLSDREETALKEAAEIFALQREALLGNPLLDFDRLVVIKRKPIGDPRRATGDKDNDKGAGKFIGLPQQSSWQLHTMPNTKGWDNEIAIVSVAGSDEKLKTIYRPETERLLSEMDLHFDGNRIMFSMPDANGLWQIFEIGLDSRNLRQISNGSEAEVHNFDSCYLPNGKIAFISTAVFQGVPCNASVNVGMMYLMDNDGGNIRQVCFEQDHNFCPTVMNDGRVLYLRWEYTDIPHVWARFLFTMNPDGTGQREYYGSGGYWPNGIFYARPVPGHPTKVAGIVTGHHIGRVGELVIFDPAESRYSTDGVVQRIPGYGREVLPLIEDKLTLKSWPKFLHPWPLSEKYFIAACKPGPNDLWGIYLVDVFDNILLLKEIEGYALLEPIPLRKVAKPPVIVDRVDTQRKDAIVYIQDIYTGPGLKGVPRGAVKKLRLVTYHFAYRTVAGISHRVGADGPWEPKRVLGTVNVEEDGSAVFRVPANTPISIQPLDAENKALQLMRSWMTAMPGEIVSCVGCHEKQNTTPLNQRTIASRKEPASIEPWYGPVRGFAFRREVQPVLDKYCVSCHNGSEREDGKTIADLRGNQGKFIVYKNGNPTPKVIEGKAREELVTKYGGVFDPSYIALRGYIRVGGLESDLRMLNPCEFGADTAELYQMLRKGHYGVVLDDEAWERLAVWIDLNGPCHGTWEEVVGKKRIAKDRVRRRKLQKLYANLDDDPEAIVTSTTQAIELVQPVAVPLMADSGLGDIDWAFDSSQAKRRQTAGGPVKRTIDLGNGVRLEMVMIPSGEFVMGSPDGDRDEQPLTHVTIEKPFWIGKFEITNEQYALFDPTHDSRYEDKGSWMFNEWDLGWDLNTAMQPVVRVSQKEAMAFCRWLSERTGQKVSLPTEAQWEYACRAGTDSAMNYGGPDTDFSEFANMADYTIRDYVYDARDNYSPDLVPRDARFNDGKLVSTEVGGFRPNAWGLYDMHGNVWEWTRSAYRAYPYKDDDGRNDTRTGERRVVRGGSWYDRPKRCRSAFRLSYRPWQKIYNTGFRVVIELDKEIAAGKSLR